MENVSAEINAIWILDRSGICMFEELYKDITKDGIETGLILPFFAAINIFTRESFAKSIQHIKMQDLMFFFDSNEYNTIILSTNEDIELSDEQMKGLLTSILDRFKKKYEKDLKKDWNGELSMFEEFAWDLLEMIPQKPSSFKLMRAIPDEKVIQQSKKLKELFTLDMQLKEEIKKVFEVNSGEREPHNIDSFMERLRSLGKD